MNYSEAQQGETCVDLGSGRGIDAIRLAEKVREKGFVYGIDLSDGMIRKARETAERLGGGNSAVEETDYTSRFPSKITMVHQLDKFSANKKAQEKILTNPKVSVILNSEPRAFIREGNKTVTEIENLLNNKRERLTSDGVFIFI